VTIRDDKIFNRGGGVRVIVMMGPFSRQSKPGVASSEILRTLPSRGTEREEIRAPFAEMGKSKAKQRGGE